MTLYNAHCRPVAWVVTSEIFPLDVRGAAVSITTAGNWTGNFLVAMLTPVLILCSPLDIHGTFYLLSGALLMGFFFVLLTLPETKVCLFFLFKLWISFESQFLYWCIASPSICPIFLFVRVKVWSR